MSMFQMAQSVSCVWRSLEHMVFLVAGHRLWSEILSLDPLNPAVMADLCAVGIEILDYLCDNLFESVSPNWKQVLYLARFPACVLKCRLDPAMQGSKHKTGNKPVLWSWVGVGKMGTPAC